MKKQTNTSNSNSRHKQSISSQQYVPTTGFSPSHLPKPNYQSSKLKSPSPDDHHSNILTPSKIKYLGEHSRARGLERTPYSSQKKFVKVFETTKDEKKQQYIRELESQVNILSIENRHLVKKVQEFNNKSKQSNSRGYSQKQTRYGEQNGNEGGRRNMLIIEKIKEQYRQNLSTLKMMIEQEIKQNSCIVEGACKLLQNKVDQLQEKIEDVEKIAHMAKIKFILLQEQKMAESYEKSSPIKSRRQGIPENTISDILCVSIPEQQWEQSKNSVVVSKLEDEIEKLKKIIEQTSKVYEYEKKSYIQEIQTQKQRIHDLERELSKLSQQKKPIGWSQKYEDFHNLIKKQLVSLQLSVNQLAEELQSSKQLCSKTLLDLQQKNNEIEILNREIVILRDKILDLEKHRNLLAEKNNFLENSLELAQRELKERKTMLDNALNSQSLLSRQKLLTYQKSNNSFRDNFSQRDRTTTNLLEITERIDRILKLQQDRESKFLSSTEHLSLKTPSQNSPPKVTNIFDQDLI